jgi:hypothetical protein
LRTEDYEVIRKLSDTGQRHDIRSDHRRREEGVRSLAKSASSRIRNNPHLRATLVRGAAFFLFGSGYWALLPLVARNQIAGGPDLYGLIAAMAILLPWPVGLDVTRGRMGRLVLHRSQSGMQRRQFARPFNTFSYSSEQIRRCLQDA